MHRKLVPGKRQGHHTNEAAEESGSKMGEEAFKLGRARAWRRALGATFCLRSTRIVLAVLGLRRRRRRIVGLNRDFGCSALDGWRRALAGTRIEWIPKGLSHDAYR